MDKKLLISKIVAIEYDFFKSTKSIGGPASCQSQGDTFILARTGYWNLYPKKILDSYFMDLEEALREKKNLVTLKYAYMMERTSPAEYEEIKARLPEISEEKRKIVETIISIHMFWEVEVKSRESGLKEENRPLYSREDSLRRVSVETYFRGELLTYSQRTLELLLGFYKKCFDEKVNLVQKNLEFLHGVKPPKDSNKDLNKLEDIHCEEANILRKLAIKKSQELGVPVTITILDKTGNIKLVQRMDGAILASIEISKNKALTAFHLNETTFNLSKNNELKNINLQSINGFNLCFLGGGSPIRNKGNIIGAVGISGGTVEEDLRILTFILEEFHKLN